MHQKNDVSIYTEYNVTNTCTKHNSIKHVSICRIAASKVLKACKNTQHSTTFNHKFLTKIHNTMVIFCTTNTT